MKKSIFSLLAILLFVAVSCTKQSNRIGNTPIEYGSTIPHLDTLSRTYTNSPTNTVYKVSFDNYAEFETKDVNGTIAERGLLWGYTDGSTTLENGAEDTSTVQIPTISSPYITTATNIVRLTTKSSPLYYFKYYAKLDNGTIVYSKATIYQHP